jgi:hypothetical protein
MVLGSLLAPLAAQAQVYVGPRRPGQSGVSYEPHTWARVDLLAAPTRQQTEAGGVRLYFYEQERDVAERAASAIETAYAELSVDFDYVPEQPFSYVLYSTYLDFLGTNLFPVQEGTLGVTSTRDLTIALPYFGDHRRFMHVSKHEMAHEFTIQKVRSAAAAAGTGRDPLGVYPLWFIEGLAEYYANDGLTPEAAMLARDLVTNADTRRFWGPLGFFDDAPTSVLWTYQLGHLRCVFLAETYGEQVIQDLLSRGHEAIGVTYAGQTALRGFPSLMQTVTDVAPSQMEREWQEWLRERTYQEWLDGETRPSDTEALGPTNGYILGLTASPSGQTVAYTAIDFQTYRTRIMLADRRDPRHTRRVVADSRPGVESLHPVEDRIFALGDDVLVYAAQHRGADVLTWQSITTKPVQWRGKRRKKREQRTAAELGPRRVKLHLGRKHRIRLRDHGLVGATGLSVSPDGTEAAFVGLTPDGHVDVYKVALRDRATPVQMTDDAYAERHTAWGPDGIVYASDATSNGFYALFAAGKNGAATQLTHEERDHLQPVFSGGTLLFTAWDDARLDLYEYRAADHSIIRHTRMTTGVSSPAPSDEGAWTLLQQSGSRVPVVLPREMWRDESPIPQAPTGQASSIPVRSLGDSKPYRPLDPKNWGLENGLGFFGAGPGGIYGQLFLSASDLLKERGLVLSAAAFGNLRLTDGYLAYTDQSNRVTWAVGVSQNLRFRLDNSTALRFQSAERSYGILGSARYPLDRFAYAQLDVQLGGTQYFLLGDSEGLLRGQIDPETGQNVFTLWDEKNGKARPQAEMTIRLGYDTVRYHPTTGPHGGGSVLGEVSVASQPFNDEMFGSARIDAERFVPIRLQSFFGANVFVRASAGTSFGGIYARNFFLSSFDTLRGVRFADADWLLGRHFATATAELQLPLDALLRIAILSSVEAVAGVDAGAVSADVESLWNKRVVDVALGTNLVFGPLVFRVHFARPLNVGTELPNTGRGQWVPNLSVRWLSL